MYLTLEALKAGASEQGGWNWKQQRLLGIQPPGEFGWYNALIGTEIDDDQYKKFLALKGKGRGQRDVTQHELGKEAIQEIIEKEPGDKRIVLTNALIEAGGTNRVGFNRAQLATLGIAWPPKDGWKKGLIGEEIPLSNYKRFLKLQGSTITRKRKRKKTGR